MAVIAAILLCLPCAAWAHVGNKDVFEQLTAGQYKLFVTVRMPTVIPGVAAVEVRVADGSAEVDSIRIAPVPLTGEGALHPPTPDVMKRSTEDPRFFTGSLWLMGSGSWQVRVDVDGAGGKAAGGVPVPAVALRVLKMQRSLAILLCVLGLALVAGIVGIAGAAVRESRLAPGQSPTSEGRRRGLVAMTATLALVVWLLYLGGRWWNMDSAVYAMRVYHPATLHAVLRGDTLDLWFANGAGGQMGSAEDLILDHGHLMHLYAIRYPGMDAAFHLHPTAPGGGVPGPESHLTLDLPPMPPGEYRLFADIVHRDGFPETMTATLNVPPAVQSVPLGSDDAEALPPPLSAGQLAPAYKLPDGYTMVWDKPQTIMASTPYVFRFQLLDPAGKPAGDMRPYLGMAGHAAFVKDDFSTFAHTHPEGSAAMPAMMMANGGDTSMPGMTMPEAAGEPITSVVGFPYGFPSPGRYRIFIQMKHGDTVETGVFDAEVQ